MAAAWCVCTLLQWQKKQNTCIVFFFLNLSIKNQDFIWFHRVDSKPRHERWKPLWLPLAQRFCSQTQECGESVQRCLFDRSEFILWPANPECSPMEPPENFLFKSWLMATPSDANSGDVVVSFRCKKKTFFISPDYIFKGSLLQNTALSRHENYHWHSWLQHLRNL